MPAKPELLVLGYNPTLNRGRRLLLQPWFAVALANSLTGALALISGKRFDLILLDESVPEADCQAILEVLRELPLETRILAVSREPRRLRLPAPHEEFVSANSAAILHKAAAMTGIRVLAQAAPPQPPPARPPRTTPDD